MHFHSIHILDFKSWPEAQFELHPKLNCFVGPNGSGKTNLLDALHYLCLTKSYFSHQDQQNVRDGQEFFSLEGKLWREEEEEALFCAFSKGQKKVFKRNGSPYDRLADHIGRFPVVVISPYDRDLITEHADTRRRFVDNVLSQGNATYLHHLLRYNKSLQQRNRLLKFFASNQQFDGDALAMYDAQLAEHGTVVHRERQALVTALAPRVAYYYQWISNGAEEASLAYRSALDEGSWEALLAQSLAKDRLLQYTSAGTHRDDFIFRLGGKSVRRFGSQGQQKSYLIALKLAQYEFIKQELGQVPILLLDDIFDKLDAARVAQLVQLVHDRDFGQIFITDTHPDRTRELVAQIEPEARIFAIPEDL